MEWLSTASLNAQNDSILSTESQAPNKADRRQIDHLKKENKKKEKGKKKRKKYQNIDKTYKYRQKILTRYTKGVRGFFSEKFSLEDKLF